MMVLIFRAGRCNEIPRNERLLVLLSRVSVALVFAVVQPICPSLAVSM